MTLDTVSDIQMVDPPMDLHQNIEIEKELETILNHLTDIKEVFFKSQQRDELDLTKEEKFKIGADVFSRNKLQFLIRFGDYFLIEHLEYFKKFTNGNDSDSKDLKLVLNDLSNKLKEQQKARNIRNRRFEALKYMISEESYFSEIEMMKRNPLLYDQLVGQYMTKEEKKERDKYNTQEKSSFVKILMETIERDDAEIKRKDQEKFEDSAFQESDSDSDSDAMEDDRSRSPIEMKSLWGEFKDENIKEKPRINKNKNITDDERKLLKEEFITTMYESFLDGTDEDFDYSSVDCNTKYDSIETMEHDEEDKYFDSEEPANALNNDIEDLQTSEDELDIYMSALNSNPAVCQLSVDMEKINTNT